MGTLIYPAAMSRTATREPLAVISEPDPYLPSRIFDPDCRVALKREKWAVLRLYGLLFENFDGQKFSLMQQFLRTLVCSRATQWNAGAEPWCGRDGRASSANVDVQKASEACVELATTLPAALRKGSAPASGRAAMMLAPARTGTRMLIGNNSVPGR